MAADTPASYDDFDESCRRALATILRVGTAITEQLETPTDTCTTAARGRAFAVVSLALRHTVILVRHLAQELPMREARRVQARKDILRAVQDNIQRFARPADASALRLELVERLDTPEFDADLLHRPRPDLIADLGRDLGLNNRAGCRPELRRTPDDIAILCAQAAAPAGSGLPQWAAAAAPEAQAEADAAPVPTPPPPKSASLLDHLLRER